MNQPTVAVQIPEPLYRRLHRLAALTHQPVESLVAQTLDAGIPPLAEEVPEQMSQDPIFDLLGAYASVLPLIDGIPVSEDPDLYLVAETLGEQAAGLHAWEIAPARYRQGPSGRPIRRNSNSRQP
jgi:hypothetical protein